MKILDRYVLKSLIESYIICIILVLSFYIILDLFANFEKFNEYVEILKDTHKREVSVLKLIIQYYLCHIPLTVYTLSPIITLMSAMFTVTRMARSNELTPLKACGISMYRLLLPFGIFSTFIALTMMISQEVIIPRTARELEDMKHVLHGRMKQIRSIQQCDRQGNIFYISKYYPPRRLMEDIRITIPYPGEAFKPREIIRAKRGRWIIKENGEEVMLLEDGYNAIYTEKGGEKFFIRKFKTFEMKTNIRDRHLTYPDEKNLDTISFFKLLRLLKKNPNFSAAKLTINTRFSLPLSNILLVFLGIPLMLVNQTRNFFLGVGICVIVAGGFYGFYLLCINLGYKEILNPIFAAWFPSVCFGSLSLSFLTLIHT